MYIYEPAFCCRSVTFIGSLIEIDSADAIFLDTSPSTVRCPLTLCYVYLLHFLLRVRQKTCKPGPHFYSLTVRAVISQYTLRAALDKGNISAGLTASVSFKRSDD